MTAESNFIIISLLENNTSNHFYFKNERCLYRTKTTKKDAIYLNCIENKCPCRAKIQNNTIVRTNEAPHNHRDHSARAKYEIAFIELRNAVKIERRPVRELHHEALRKLSAEAAGFMAWERVRKSLQRTRQLQLPLCRNLGELIELLETDDAVYDTYGRLRETSFYQGTANGHLVFANLEIVAALPQNFEICVDATFSVTPFRTRQLLVILAVAHNRPRPILYAVMTGKAQIDYEAVYHLAREVIFSFDGIERTPSAAICDFEVAMRKGLVVTWPDIVTNGCNFHFNQSIRRKASKMPSLAGKITGQTTHHNVLRKFMRLSLLPIDRIRVGIDSLVADINSDQELATDFHTFIDYFNRTWITTYDPKEWCVSGLTRRTNNHLEGYNNTIKHTIPFHPSPWIFLDELLNLAYDTSASYYADVRNNAPPPPDRSDITEQLNAALAELNNGEINELEFLSMLSE